jgi:asparagine synthase (glutamine-hydrolysing)
MCGIYSFLNYIKYNDKIEVIKAAFEKGSDRGPEFSKLISYEGHNATFGFHRLAINGLNEESHQPLWLDDKYMLICNGEIYNYKELAQKYGFTYETESDCECIIHMFKSHGIARTVQEIDGVFAFILVDLSGPHPSLFVARDPFGVRPLFECAFNDSVIFASTLKMFHTVLEEIDTKPKMLRQFSPGTYHEYGFNESLGRWIPKDRPHSYFTLSNILCNQIGYKESLELIRSTLTEAVRKRVVTTDRPIACLLSGGLDSSLICSIVVKIWKELGHTSPIETYSIGMPGSVDLKYAKRVAEFLGTEHHEVVVMEKEFIHTIPKVVNVCETFDTTTIRASVGNYIISKYISNHSDAKVIFNGDGSDEVAGGYLYFHSAPNDDEFDIECKRLLRDIAWFDVLRSDRSISSNGLEARTPFLDKSFVRSYFEIPRFLRNHNNQDKMEKYLIRDAFKGYLPDEVLYRTKEAFSDGVSTDTKSWYEIIQEYCQTRYTSDISGTEQHPDIIFQQDMNTEEKKYYYSLFLRDYKYASGVIPYYWMPRFVEATDASARTLDIYTKKSNVNV